MNHRTEIDGLRTRLERSEWLPIDCGHRISASLQQLTGVSGRPVQWWLQRLLIEHLYGQQMPARELIDRLSVQSDITDCLVPVYLLAQIQLRANETSSSLDLYLHEMLHRALHGWRLSDVCVELEQQQWQEDGCSIKIHLTEQLDIALTQLAKFLELSANDVVRNSLLIHLYGRLGYEMAVGARLWVPRRKLATDFDVVFSRRAVPHRTQELLERGKASVEFRLFCPSPMKQQLQELADAVRMALSPYLRNMLLTMMFGMRASC